MDQDGAVQEDEHVAEISHLLSRAAVWPRWPAVDRAPHQAVAAARQEPDRHRVGHRCYRGLVI